MNKLAAAIVVAACVFVPSSAWAVTLQLAGDPGDYFQTQLNVSPNGAFDLDANANYNTWVPSTVGHDGQFVDVINYLKKSASNGLAVVGGAAKVTYTYLGKEAGFTNAALEFSTGPDNPLFSTGSSNVGDQSGPYLVAAGLLPFKLTSNDGLTTETVFNNGTAQSLMNIAYVLFNGNMSALVFLDDFGAGPDSDYDDIGIRIDITPVPLPAALPLLGAGIGALGFMGWRKKRAAAAFA